MIGDDQVVGAPDAGQGGGLVVDEGANGATCCVAKLGTAWSVDRVTRRRWKELDG